MKSDKNGGCECRSSSNRYHFSIVRIPPSKIHLKVANNLNLLSLSWSSVRDVAKRLNTYMGNVHRVKERLGLEKPKQSLYAKSVPKNEISEILRSASVQNFCVPNNGR